MKMKKRILLFIMWLIILIFLKKYTSFSGIFWGKGLFFAFWLPFVFILKVPFQVSVIFGAILLLTSPFSAFISVQSGERIAVYSWGLLTVGLLQRLSSSAFAEKQSCKTTDKGEDFCFGGIPLHRSAEKVQWMLARGATFFRKEFLK